MKTRSVITIATMIALPLFILPVASFAAEVMPNDPVLPQNNLPSNQRQNPSGTADIPVNNAAQNSTPSTNSSTNTSTGVNVGPGNQIAPKTGSQNGTLTGNGAGVGPESGR